MKTELNWYALYTRSRWEKKVTELLKRKGVEVYCPLNRVLRQWHDRKKWVEEPLFSSYVFVYINLQDQLKVKETEGVLNFVHWLGKPAVIKDQEVKMIKRFLSEYKQVTVERTTVRPMDAIRILEGPLVNQEGRVIEVYNKTVKIELPSLGYNIVAQVEKANLEVIKAVRKPQEIVTVR